MKRILGLVIVSGLAFYVGWPAWSGYSIRNAFQAKDAASLGAKIDFDRVRESLRPTVSQKVEDGFERYQSQLGGAGGMILGQLRKDAVPKIVEATMKALLTPDMIIRIASEGGSIKDSLDRIMREQIGRGVPAEGGTAAPQGLGGLLGRAMKAPAAQAPATEAPAAAVSAPAGAAKFSLSNIKSFTFNGPLSFRVGVAKDPAAAEPDVTAEMSFTGGDWKVTGLVPRP